jgi:hypothetical protein
MSEQLNLASVEKAVRDFIKTLDADIIIQIDYENLVQILVDLTMAQSGAPRLTYSITRAGGEYNVVAKGYTKQVSLLDLVTLFCGKDRTADKSCIKDMIWHPKEYAISVQANSINPRSSSASSKTYGNTRLVGRPVH